MRVLTAEAFSIDKEEDRYERAFEREGMERAAKGSAAETRATCALEQKNTAKRKLLFLQSW